MNEMRGDRPALRIALLGLGTVGRAVARTLIGDGPHLERVAGGMRLELAVVGVREPGRARGVDLPGVAQTSDLAAAALQPDVDVVVELLGGIDPAYELVRSTLRAGKAVVTANKALLALRGAELEALARQVGAPLRFEAAVGGGIPVLSPLAADLAANHVRSVRGIVNGSTNYLLTAMTEGGRDYNEAMAEARELGYLEADPSADLEGRDAADKIAILVRLAFGRWPDVRALRSAPAWLDGDGLPGVTGVTAAHIGTAADLGFAIKLVALAEAHDGDGSSGVRAGVVPAAVPQRSTLGSTNGVRNLVEILAEPVGRVSFAGPGAGGPATSSAILADLLAIARREGSTWAGLPEPGSSLAAGDPLDGERRWLVCLAGPMRTALPEGFVEIATGSAAAGGLGAAVFPGPGAETSPPAETGLGAPTGLTGGAGSSAPVESLALLLRPCTLAAARGALMTGGADPTTTLYPVVEAD